jgi:DNA polymerase-2
MERFITADLTFAGQAVNLTSADNQAYQRFEQVKCKRIDKAQQTDIALSSVSLDIECSMSGELYSIGLYSEHCQQVLMIANTEEIAHEQQATRDIDIVWQANEQQLLVSLLAWFTQHDPDIIMGWNVINMGLNLLLVEIKKYHIGVKIKVVNSNLLKLMAV